MVTVVGEDRNDVIITSAEPGIVEVERTSFTDIELRALGEGETKVSIEEGMLRNEYPIEVRAHDRFEVLHAERGWAVDPSSVSSLENLSVLADASQDIVVAYFDADGLLHGRGLASVALPRGTWPAISTPCGAEFEWRFDGGCWDPAPGDHLLRVTTEGEDDLLVPFMAVPADDIVDILMVRPEEDELAPGELVFVEVVGLTADGTHVHGVHATFFGLGLGTFAYEFVPELEPETIPVEALGIEKNLVYRGE
ncbi:MAG: hypothetical protein WBN01_13625 [Polyangiales bacterium]